MSDVAIRVDDLSKMYRIGAKESKRNGLGQSLRGFATAPFSYLRQMWRPPTTDETLWALKDVSFEVNRGEVVGVIGRNGAGKSTLLKILSRITEPTSGRVELHGRVGSLLEVGTGFHPELTGRENIYLNGAILGMRRAEIDRKFDEIVEFSGVERFLDTPVKRYSSGMYVRLAFSVAAHLETEILLVDEVLAVGDAVFQKKCLGKLGEVSRHGRTILLVSHNVAAVSQICASGVLLDGGSGSYYSAVRTAIETYLDSSQETDPVRKFSDAAMESSNDTGLAFRTIRILDSSGCPNVQLECRDGFQVELQYFVSKPIRFAQVAIEITNADGICILSTTDLDRMEDPVNRILREGLYVSRCSVPGSLLRPGKYTIGISSSVPGQRLLDQQPQAITLEVMAFSGVELLLSQGRAGVIMPILDWSTQLEE